MINQKSVNLASFFQEWFLLSQSQPVTLRSFYEVYRDCINSPSNISGVIKNGICDQRLWGLLEGQDIYELMIFDTLDVKFMKEIEPCLDFCNFWIESYFKWSVEKLNMDTKKWRAELFGDLIRTFLEKHMCIMGFEDDSIPLNTISSLHRLLGILPLPDVLKAIKTAINGANSYCIESKIRSKKAKQRILIRYLGSIYPNFKNGNFIAFQRIAPEILNNRYRIDISSEVLLEEFWSSRIHLNSKNLLTSIKSELSLK